MLGRQRDGEKDTATVPMKDKTPNYMYVLGVEARAQLGGSGLVLVSCPQPQWAQVSAVSL